MAFLTTNYENLDKNTGTTFEPLVKGNYELIIKNPTLRAKKDNSGEYISFQLVVRNDLNAVPALSATNAKFHDRVIFAGIYQDKETKEFKKEDLQFYLEAVGVPAGTTIESLQDYLDLINGKPVKAYVTQYENTYNGITEIRNNVWANSVNKSDFPQVQHVFKDKTADPFAGVTSNGNEPVNADTLEKNLPF